MSRIYITNENGAQTEHSELEARQLLRQGLISKRAMYWKSGMAQSRPVTDLLKDFNAEKDESQHEEPGIGEKIASKIVGFLRGFKK